MLRKTVSRVESPSCIVLSAKTELAPYCRPKSELVPWPQMSTIPEKKIPHRIFIIALNVNL
jgi:hypothetical protein